ncbi:hypothetical protein D9611_009291 [Ephemerocybe angulata]|uniref:Uncharacterized protein n=1 Tax=Ephemerocybe angulata TaxID=980116 RepID=A0A8H5BGR5_9AGAR|nr:hypothetical protein D9611_009291 [Tulosesus angulatus]
MAPSSCLRDHHRRLRTTSKLRKRRYEVTKIAPAFIHTSGTGLRIDEAYGQYGTDAVYHDSGKWTKMKRLRIPNGPGTWTWRS